MPRQSQEVGVLRGDWGRVELPLVCHSVVVDPGSIRGAHLFCIRGHTTSQYIRWVLSCRRTCMTVPTLCQGRGHIILLYVLIP